jgi:hypothetical protein
MLGSGGDGSGRNGRDSSDYLMKRNYHVKPAMADHSPVFKMLIAESTNLEQLQVFSITCFEEIRLADVRCWRKGGLVKLHANDHCEAPSTSDVYGLDWVMDGGWIGISRRLDWTGSRL